VRVRILGCGDSAGTPSVDRGWGKCDPENPKNRRLRPSILIEDGGEEGAKTQILVDTSPDLREQLLQAEVKRLDAVIYTHAHADHSHGINDLRPINRMIAAPLDVYGDAATLEGIQECFAYAFEPLAENAAFYYKPTLIARVIEDGSCFDVSSIKVSAFEQDHGYCKTMGYRFGSVAYSTDVVEMPEKSFEALENLDVWIVGAFTENKHPTHAHVDKALDWISRVRPKRAVLTHLSGLLDYAALQARLPGGVEVAFDGMVVDTGDL
jgi:phosphoribosyl 1,2-cyclic phosphate phosphodiesterase